jgi:NAD(P)-dependent dehydrogenase (short-subunit alcohol dehydrogenase family)
VCARNLKKGAATIQSIKDLHPSAKITLLEIDHVSLNSVVAAAKTVLANETRLDGLINNAGIMMTPLEITKDGYEMQWQTNYLAHWVLTSHLLPLLLKTAKNQPAGSVRIVNLTSSGHVSFACSHATHTDHVHSGRLRRVASISKTQHLKALKTTVISTDMASQNLQTFSTQRHSTKLTVLGHRMPGLGTARFGCLQFILDLSKPIWQMLR